MNVPLFFLEEMLIRDGTTVLDEDTSRHCIQVLRMKMGEYIQLTDGKGTLLTTELMQEHKKAASVRVLSATTSPDMRRKITIAISLIKNAGRFEWFIEKATEIGIHEIVPLLCERTEKQHFRSDRMKSILVSAMLQSRQVWLPALNEPISFRKAVGDFQAPHKFIAHCLDEDKRLLVAAPGNEAVVILIGPEGDFTKGEIEMAIAKQFVPVTLGETRLRSETAGVVAAVLLKIK